MPKRKTASDYSLSPDLLQVWVARLLLHEPYWDRLSSSEQRPSTDSLYAWIARLFAMPSKKGTVNPDAILAYAQAVANTKCMARRTRMGIIHQNLKMLDRFIPLQPLEQDILALRVYVREEWRLLHLFKQTVPDDTSWSGTQLQDLLVVMLGSMHEQIQAALSAESALVRTRLMRVSSMMEHGFLSKLQPLPGIIDAMLCRSLDANSFFGRFSNPAPSAELDLGDYPHMAGEVSLLQRYLDGCMRTQATGANVLIHGVPGIGKTEFARAIAKAMDIQLFEIPSFENVSGDSLPPTARLDLLKLNQTLFSRSNGSVLLFDEIEDAFRQTSEPKKAEEDSAHNKAWLNQLLETNTTPTLWISNRIDHLDRAFLRRFDLIIGMRTPPENVRRRILQQHFRHLPVSQEWLAQTARDNELPPAFHARAAKVLTLAGIGDADSMTSDERLIQRHFKQAYGCKSTVDAPITRTIYDPAMVSADKDVGRLLSGVQRTGRGRLLFHGPPGTGKTALAHHIAHTLDRPLIERRASDLLSMWVGGTEKLIRSAFEEARDENAILLIDEADSFLGSREQAQRNWEISQVNEMLTQIERHPGVLVCCTNHLRHLDAAVLRRFPLKLQFGWLPLEKRISLFWRYVDEECADENIREYVARRLSGMDMLAPGDFAACAMAAEALDQCMSFEWLLDSLAAEIQLKPNGNMRRIGFAA